MINVAPCSAVGTMLLRLDVRGCVYSRATHTDGYAATRPRSARGSVYASVLFTLSLTRPSPHASWDGWNISRCT
eukprot:2125163-Prymnesium_polylepis.1